MAQEITTTASISYTKSGVTTLSLSDTSKKFDVTGVHCVRATQNIGTSIEAIAKGDISTLGWAYIRNLDATNYVEIFAVSTDTVPFLKLKAGEFFIGRLGCTAPCGKANSSAVNIEYIFLED